MGKLYCEKCGFDQCVCHLCYWCWGDPACMALFRFRNHLRWEPLCHLHRKHSLVELMEVRDL